MIPLKCLLMREKGSPSLTTRACRGDSPDYYNMQPIQASMIASSMPRLPAKLHVGTKEINTLKTWKDHSIWGCGPTQSCMVCNPDGKNLPAAMLSTHGPVGVHGCRQQMMNALLFVGNGRAIACSIMFSQGRLPAGIMGRSMVDWTPAGISGF
jgi:hypothetical protein